MHKETCSYEISEAALCKEKVVFYVNFSNNFRNHTGCVACVSQLRSFSTYRKIYHSGKKKTNLVMA